MLGEACQGSATWDRRRRQEARRVHGRRLRAGAPQVLRRRAAPLPLHAARPDGVGAGAAAVRARPQDVTQPLLDVWAFEGSRQLRDRLVSRRDAQRFDNIISSSLRNHFDHAIEDADAVTFSALLGGSSERVGASPDRALTLRARRSATSTPIVARRAQAVRARDEGPQPGALPRGARQRRPHGPRALDAGRQPAARRLVGRRPPLGALARVPHARARALHAGDDARLLAQVVPAELKTILPKVGVQGTRAVLLLEDHQLRDDKLIECVNSLLSAGELPGLFEPQELEPMLAPLKEEMGQHGYKHRSLFDFFVARVQQNLHVALCMDPPTSSFLMRCESNPALYTRCSMLWMGAWDDASMEALAAKFFDGHPGRRPAAGAAAARRQADDGAAPRAPRRWCATARHDATPRMYVCAPQGVAQDLRLAAAEDLRPRRAPAGGLDKLAEAEQEVDALSKTANEQRALLTRSRRRPTARWSRSKSRWRARWRSGARWSTCRASWARRRRRCRRRRPRSRRSSPASSRCSTRRGRRWAASRRTTSTRSVRSRCRPSRSATCSRACSRSWATSTRRGSR